MTRELISVFCASSDHMEPEYYAITEQLGEEIAKAGYDLIWGGAAVGLMGAVARGAKKQGGKVIGAIARKIYDAGVTFEMADEDELIITQTMSQRKDLINERADAFICLPGGYGTLEEIFEVLTLVQLGYIYKPVVLLNVKGFFDPLLDMIDVFVDEKALKSSDKHFYYATGDIEEALSYIRNFDYNRPDGTKWD